VGEVPSLPDVGGLYTTKWIVVIGIHGGTILRTSLGDATGTSPKFASTMKKAIETFLRAKGIRLECDTKGHGGVRILVYRLRGRAPLRDGSRSAYHTTKAGWRPGACIIGSTLIFYPSRPGLRICISMLAYSSLSTLI